MDREDVNLIITYKPVDDTVRTMNHFADQRIVEFRNGPTRLGNGTNRSVAAISWDMTTNAY